MKQFGGASWDEVVNDVAKSAKGLTAMWPSGHRLHDSIPGLISAFLLMEVEEDTKRGHVAQLVKDSYAKAGMPGHRHAQLLCDAVVELMESQDEDLLAF